MAHARTQNVEMIVVARILSKESSDPRMGKQEGTSGGDGRSRKGGTKESCI